MMSDHITNSEESIVICIINNRTNSPKVIHLQANESEFIKHIHKSGYSYSVLERSGTPQASNILTINHLFIRVSDGFRRIAVSSITHLQASRSYCEIHLFDAGTILVSISMSETYSSIISKDFILHLCSLFFETNADDKFDTAMGTIIHELSHLSAGTEDHEYGKKKCKKLAIENNNLSVNNADSYQYYCESFIK